MMTKSADNGTSHTSSDDPRPRHDQRHGADGGLAWSGTKADDDWQQTLLTRDQQPRDRYFRKNLIQIHGAKAVLPYLVAQETPLGHQAHELSMRAHKNLVVVVLADKLARTLWAVLVNRRVDDQGHQHA